MTIIQTGIPNSLFNGVIGPAFAARTMTKRVDEAMGRFRKAGVPMEWLLGPSSAPQGLDDYLQKQGVVAQWASPGMAVNLEDVGRQGLPVGVEIRAVEDLATLRVCGNTLAKGFGMKGAVRKGMVDVTMGWGTSSTRRWYLAYLNGTPVAVSNLTLQGDVAAIYCVATVPEARGRGIGSAITRWPLLVARRLGFDVAVIEASKMGFPIYKRIGFRECCRFRIYEWSPEKNRSRSRPPRGAKG